MRALTRILAACTVVCAWSQCGLVSAELITLEGMVVNPGARGSATQTSPAFHHLVGTKSFVTIDFDESLTAPDAGSNAYYRAIRSFVWTFENAEIEVFNLLDESEAELVWQNNRVSVQFDIGGNVYVTRHDGFGTHEIKNFSILFWPATAIPDRSVQSLVKGILDNSFSEISGLLPFHDIEQIRVDFHDAFRGASPQAVPEPGPFLLLSLPAGLWLSRLSFARRSRSMARESSDCRQRVR